MQPSRSHIIVSILALGALLLSGCSLKAATPEPTATISFEQLSTSVAGTVIAQITANAPTITETPTITLTPTFTATSQQPTNTTRPTPSSCANAKYIADVTIPDGTQMPAGTTFTKTWRVENDGTCPWTTAFRLSFSYGEAMSGQSVAIPATVAVGAQVDLSVDLKVPNKTGKLNGVWTLVDDKNQPFGELLTVVINVGAATPSVSPTPTATATFTPTATP